MSVLLLCPKEASRAVWSAVVQFVLVPCRIASKSNPIRIRPFDIKSDPSSTRVVHIFRNFSEPGVGYTVNNEYLITECVESKCKQQIIPFRRGQININDN